MHIAQRPLDAGSLHALSGRITERERKPPETCGLRGGGNCYGGLGYAKPAKQNMLLSFSRSHRRLNALQALSLAIADSWCNYVFN